MFKTKTKILSVALISVLALSLAGCGGKTASSSGGSSAPEAAKSNYPQKPITIVAPSGAGGGLDMAARMIAKVGDKTKLISQPIQVENKPGGGQVTGTAEFVTKNSKDDYTLLLPSTPLVMNYVKKEGNSPVGYTDLTPLAMLQIDYGVIAVSPDSKYKDLKSLLEAIKADPSKITVAGGSAPGALDHLNIILPAKIAGIDPKSMKYTAYDGGGAAVTALLGGHADVLSSDVSSISQYVKAGKVKVIGVSSPVRLKGEVSKDFPTYKELGYNTELANWRGVFGGKNMSADAKKYWEETLKKLTSTPEFQQECDTAGVIPSYMSGADFTKQLEKDTVMYKEVYTSLGMAK